MLRMQSGNEFKSEMATSLKLKFDLICKYLITNEERSEIQMHIRTYAYTYIHTCKQRLPLQVFIAWHSTAKFAYSLTTLHCTTTANTVQQNTIVPNWNHPTSSSGVACSAFLAIDTSFHGLSPLKASLLTNPSVCLRFHTLSATLTVSDVLMNGKIDVCICEHVLKFTIIRNVSTNPFSIVSDAPTRGTLHIEDNHSSVLSACAVSCYYWSDKNLHIKKSIAEGFSHKPSTRVLTMIFHSI